jgi:REP element-mobilizing transposase RayT
MSKPEYPQRKILRLPHYDYTRAGGYFVTLCMRNHACALGDIEGGKMKLSRLGRIVEDCWGAIPIHFSNVELDIYTVMPNHLHGILIFARRAGGACPAPTKQRRAKPATSSLSAVVGSFKSAVTKKVNTIQNTPGRTFWQRGYYEHVIRNEADCDRIREYICHNPDRWAEDEENPARTKP